MAWWGVSAHGVVGESIWRAAGVKQGTVDCGRGRRMRAANAEVVGGIGGETHSERAAIGGGCLLALLFPCPLDPKRGRKLTVESCREAGRHSECERA